MGRRKRLRSRSPESLHRIRQRRQRAPSAAYLLGRKPPRTPELRTLRRDGIVRLEQFMPAEALATLQADMARMVRDLEQEDARTFDMYERRYHNRDEKLFITNDPFADSPALLDLCLDRRLVDLVHGYMRKRPYIHQASGYRLLSGAETGSGSFQWHHDAWGRRVNVMFLLTDTGPGDQSMSYKVGAHRIHHTLGDYCQSRIDLSKHEAWAALPTFEAYGRAGDVFVFDSNGLHSGNRTDGRDRDTFIVCYATDPTYTWNLTLPASRLEGRSEAELQPLRWILQANADPERAFAPRHKSWRESLDHVSAWF